MSNFSSAVEEVRAPLRVIPLPPSAFSSKWRGAPKETVQVGVTLLSSADIETGRFNASSEAWRMFPRREDDQARESAFDDLLVRWLVARGTCDPEDVRAPFALWKGAPEDIAREALSLEGVKAIWDAIDGLAAETSPVDDEIDEDGLVELMELTCFIDELPRREANRVRRMLSHCLSALRAVKEFTA